MFTNNYLFECKTYKTPKLLSFQSLTISPLVISQTTGRQPTIKRELDIKFYQFYAQGNDKENINCSTHYR